MIGWRGRGFEKIQEATPKAPNVTAFRITIRSTNTWFAVARFLLICYSSAVEVCTNKTLLALHLAVSGSWSTLSKCIARDQSKYNTQTQPPYTQFFNVDRKIKLIGTQLPQCCYCRNQSVSTRRGFITKQWTLESVSFFLLQRKFRCAHFLFFPLVEPFPRPLLGDVSIAGRISRSSYRNNRAVTQAASPT